VEKLTIDVEEVKAKFSGTIELKMSLSPKAIVYNRYTC
jgi:hypothetical protein